MSLHGPRFGGVRSRGFVAGWTLLAAFAASDALAQEGRGMGGRQGPPPTIIHGGTVHTGTGEVLEPGIVMIAGGKIRGVRQGELPANAGGAGANVIDASGLHVFPGLVHADARFLVDAQVHAGGRGGLALDIRDGLDLFRDDDRTLAWSQGITTAYVGPAGTAQLDGLGAVIKIKDGRATADVVLVEEAAATGRLGGGSASNRLRTFKALRDQLKAAEAYIESWEDYEEKYEEYLKELEKARKEAGEDKPKEEKKPDGDAKKEDAKPKEGGEAGEGGPPNRGGPGGRRGRGGGGGDEGGGSAFAVPGWLQDSIAQERRRGGRPQGGGRPPQQGGGGGGEKKEDEGPKAPKKPAFDPNKEVLKRVLQGEVPLRLRVDGEADILNALELLEAYPFRMILVGGAQAHRLGEELEEAGIPILLTQTTNVGSKTLSAAEELIDEDIDVALITTSSANQSARFLALAAATAVAGGLDPEDALAAITSKAAEILGVGDRVGSIAEGMDADVVIASGPPMGSATRVERVLVDGSVVYER